MPWLTANTLTIRPIASHGPESQSQQSMSLAASHLQLMFARAALLARTYSIGITRTVCDRIGPVHLLQPGQF